MRLFGRARKPAPRAAPALPAGVRAYAIGDVHGRLDLLVELLDRIRADDAARPAAETHLVLLGDLIDRGPSSRDVIELLRKGLPGFDQVHALMGNHEEILLHLLEEPATPLMLQYLKLGGYQTLESYGTPERLLEGAELHDPAVLLAGVPAAHRAFLRTLDDSVTLGDYLFVHAGIRPGVPLDEQTAADLRWIRAPFLRSGTDHGVTVVHGHTIAAAPEFLPNRIGIDTGAYATGMLTALGLDGTEQWLLATGEPDERAQPAPRLPDET